MIEQVQVGGAVKGIGAIAGKKGGHSGKNGLFATLVALFAGQHNQNPQIKNQSGKTHRTADTVLQAAKTSVSAQHRKTRTITIDIEGAKKISGKNNKKSALTVSDEKRPTHARRLKDQNAAVGLAAPVTSIQTSKTDAHTMEVRQKKLSGMLQQKHTGAEITSRNHVQVAELSMPIQGHVRQASLHKQEAGAKETGLKEQKVVQKLSDSPELLVNNNLADRKPAVWEGKNHIKQSADIIPHALNNYETASTVKPETAAGKTVPSAPTASGLAAEISPEINAENISKEINSKILEEIDYIIKMISVI
jgi:carbon monoxide dehydrogenase subunit G